MFFSTTQTVSAPTVAIPTVATPKSPQSNAVPTATDELSKPQPDVRVQPPPPSPPDAGLTAWLQCIGAFILFFNSWGLVNTFGVFQTYYTEQYLPDASPSQISWIGSISAFWLVFGSIITGPLLDRGWMRSLVFAGTILTVLGTTMTSLATQYWQILLAQGFCSGLGFSCLFMPSIGVLPTYFAKKRSLTLGIAASGSSFGAIIYSIMFHELQPRVGFGWAVRAIALVVLTTQMIPLVVMKQRLKPPKARNLWDKSAWSRPDFLFYAGALFFGFLGLYIPFFNLQTQALQEHIVTETMAFYLVVFLNAGSVLGRLIPNHIADRLGPLNTLLPCTLVAGTLAFIWIRIRSAGGLVAFSVLYGCFSGAFVSISPVVTASMSPRLSSFGTWNGMLSIPMGFGLLLGNPIAGAVVTTGYCGLQAFCGACGIAAALALLATRIRRAGPEILRKI